MDSKLLLVGAMGSLLLAIAATLVSDMHGIGDWFLTSLQAYKQPLNPAPIYSAPYWLAGYIGEPLLIISILTFTVGFYGS